MEKIKIFTDSASDIAFGIEDDLNIGMMNFYITMGDQSYLSRVDFNNDEYYKLMEDFDGIPLTSQITAYQFQELYEQYYKEGYTDVIGILINAEGSATYGNSVMAYDMFLEEHPEAKDVFRVHTIDSRSYTGAYGYAVVEAAKMVQNGKTVEEILAFVNEWISHAVVYFVPYSLKYAGKSGRIPSAAALVGDKLGIKPAMRIWDHEISTAFTIRGEKKVVKKIADKVFSEMKKGTPYMVVHGDRIELKEQMEAAMTELTGYAPADVFQIGAAVASNAGPTLVGVIFQENY